MEDDTNTEVVAAAVASQQDAEVLVRAVFTSIIKEDNRISEAADITETEVEADSEGLVDEDFAPDQQEDDSCRETVEDEFHTGRVPQVEDQHNNNIIVGEPPIRT